VHFYADFEHTSIIDDLVITTDKTVYVGVTPIE
jgi:hypothetical protein